jgi:hypothetical protein
MAVARLGYGNRDYDYGKERRENILSNQLKKRKSVQTHEKNLQRMRGDTATNVANIGAEASKKVQKLAGAAAMDRTEAEIAADAPLNSARVKEINKGIELVDYEHGRDLKADAAVKAEEDKKKRIARAMQMRERVNTMKAGAEQRKGRGLLRDILEAPNDLLHMTPEQTIAEIMNEIRKAGNPENWRF